MSKQLIRLKLLIFVIALFAVSCDKDNDEVRLPEKENRIITKTVVSAEQINENKKIAKFLDGYQEYKKSGDSKSMVHDSINGFYIDTSEAIYLEIEDYHSYTFSIYRNSEEDMLENLVFSVNIDASYDAYLWRYDIGVDETIDETTNIEVIELHNFDNDVVFMPKGPPCQNGWRVEIDYVDIYGNIHDNYDDDCVGCYPIADWVRCNNTGGSNGGNGDGDNGSGDNGSGNNNTGNNGDGNNNTGNNDDGNNENDDEPWDGDIGEDNPDGGGSSSGGDSSTAGNEIRGNVITTPNERCKGGKVKVNGICQCPEGKIEDEVGNCIHENIPNNDCAQLGVLSDIPLVKTRLNELRQETGNFEKGLKINKDPSNDAYVPSPIIENSNGSNHINIHVNGYTSAIAHTHPDYVFYKMYSAPDILKMAQMASRIEAQDGTTVHWSEITHILIFNIDGTDFTFALRFDDLESVQKLQDIVNDPDDRDDFKKKLKNNYENDTSGPPAYQADTSISQQQRHMFNLFNEYDLNISLYEANFNPNGTINNWQRINKDSLDKENCN